MKQGETLEQRAAVELREAFGYADGKTVAVASAFARAVLEEAKPYMKHSDLCEVWAGQYRRAGKCSCGLSALLRELEG